MSPERTQPDDGTRHRATDDDGAWKVGEKVVPQSPRRSSSRTANHRRQLTEGPWVIVA
jgi:hypothetical protein